MPGTISKMLPSEPFAQLIHYGITAGWIKNVDVAYFANRYSVKYPVKADEIILDCTNISPKPFQIFIEELITEMAQLHLFSPDTVYQRDIVESELIALLLPKPSELILKYESLLRESSKAATDYLYTFSKNTNYIKSERIKENIEFEVPTIYGNLDITINLSKPEKDPLDIAQVLRKESYPNCVLCKEQVGFLGGNGAQPRGIHRIVPVTMGTELFWIQYSPYQYYLEHLICFKDEHTPMCVTEHTLDRLVDFVDQYPHYFIGSNASLPYVGGSILNHEHYQGGAATFPIEQAKVLHTWKKNQLVIAQLHWPLNVIKISSSNREEVLLEGKRWMKNWFQAEVPGIANTNNAITPIVRKENDLYTVYLALRNNETTPDRPLGKYHVHPMHHHIKKENIGLIEVMGLAILPGRLKTDVETILAALSGIGEIPLEHKEWITSVQVDSKDDLYKEIGLKFQYALEDCKVLKDDVLKDWIEGLL